MGSCWDWRVPGSPTPCFRGSQSTIAFDQKVLDPIVPVPGAFELRLTGMDGGAVRLVRNDGRRSTVIARTAMPDTPEELIAWARMAASLAAGGNDG